MIVPCSRCLRAELSPAVHSALSALRLTLTDYNRTGTASGRVAGTPLHFAMEHESLVSLRPSASWQSRVRNLVTEQLYHQSINPHPRRAHCASNPPRPLAASSFVQASEPPVDRSHALDGDAVR